MSQDPKIEYLSNAPLAGSGLMIDQFRSLGVNDFHGACRWLLNLPYGKNSRSNDLLTLFEDECGTCTTKHGVAAALAMELGIPVSKYLVYYKLDGSVRLGAENRLKDEGLRFVPSVHCVLGEGIRFVDLTWGNATGKLKNLEDFELWVKVPPMPDPAEYDALFVDAVRWYQRRDAALAQTPLETIRAVKKACEQVSIDCAC